MPIPAYVENLRRDGSSRARRKRAEVPVAEPAVAAEPVIANPFQQAANDLEADWNEMVERVNAAERGSQEFRDQNIWLAGEVERLTAELAARDAQIPQLERAAGVALERYARLCGQLELIGASFQTVIREGGRPTQPPVVEQRSDDPYRPRISSTTQSTRAVVEINGADESTADEVQRLVRKLPVNVYPGK